MAYKQYDHQSFSADVNGNYYAFFCSSQKTRYGFRHICDFRRPGEFNYTRAKCCYYNRTWKCFKYETVLRAAIAKCDKADQAGLTAIIIHKEEKDARDRAAVEFENFKSEYDKLTPGMKDALKNTTLHSDDDARAVYGIMKMANIITGKN